MQARHLRGHLRTCGWWWAVTDPTKCAHRFMQRPWPWLRIRDCRWICVDCLMLTRHYNSLDRQMGRPVHRRMTVAYRGVNTIDSRGGR